MGGIKNLPCFRSGKTCIENYRPTTTLGNFTKVFEVLFFDKLSHPQISEYQHESSISVYSGNFGILVK